MSPEEPISVVFFDIGGTLGERDASGAGIVPYPDTIQLLLTMREILGLRLGVITNLPPEISTNQIRAMLHAAGLLRFLAPDGVISSHDTGIAKPNAGIYQFAAMRMNVPIGRCLYIGETPAEVQGARRAGMSGILKPRWIAPLE
jgi:FMN phosphatase YigB (HAD superfamily)